MLELDKYQNRGLVWYGSRNDKLSGRLSSGYAELDKALSGGWPPQGVFELNSPLGVGELRLILPYLEQKQRSGKLIFIAPPNLLEAEFFAANNIDLQQLLILPVYEPDAALWAAEQCLKSGCCSAVVLWQKQVSIKQARRLMLASEQGESSLFLYRLQPFASKQNFKQHVQQSMKLNVTQSAKQTNSAEFGHSPFMIPATVNMHLQASHHGLQVNILKQRGGQAQKLSLDMQQQWPSLTTSPVSYDNVVPFAASALH